MLWAKIDIGLTSKYVYILGDGETGESRETGETGQSRETGETRETRVTGERRKLLMYMYIHHVHVHGWMCT